MTRFLILLSALALGVSYSVQAAEPIDLPLLRDSICDFETRGVMDRDLTEPGPAGEIGRCQIRVSTARQLGFDGHWTLLLLGPINEAWAMEKIRQCHKRKHSIFGTAACYNRGYNTIITKDDAGWGYAYRVRQMYYAALLARQRTFARN